MDSCLKSKLWIREMQMKGWQPIDTLPEGEHVLLWFPVGEREVGGMECATVYISEDGEWGFWTHGGPNSGSDWWCDEKPTFWMPLPDPPSVGPFDD